MQKRRRFKGEISSGVNKPRRKHAIENNTWIVISYRSVARQNKSPYSRCYRVWLDRRLYFEQAPIIYSSKGTRAFVTRLEPQILRSTQPVPLPGSIPYLSGSAIDRGNPNRIRTNTVAEMFAPRYQRVPANITTGARKFQRSEFLGKPRCHVL